MSPQFSSSTAKNQKPSLKKKLTVLAVIISVAAFLIFLISSNPPQSKRSKPSKKPQITVQTKVLAAETYQVMVESFGTVKPRTQSILFAQVSGQITGVSEQFRDGGF